MLITIAGKRWRLERVHRLKDGARRVAGLCDNPKTPSKSIQIDDGQDDQEEIDTILHEVMHASSWPIDEEFIRRYAADAARILTKLGYRKGTDGEQTGTK